uniref:Uncharacterized protein n=1 Tax=Leptobrachium leishanense TaxID=445787 RepID=A0A8C5R2A2_9ANUR
MGRNKKNPEDPGMSGTPRKTTVGPLDNYLQPPVSPPQQERPTAGTERLAPGADSSAADRVAELIAGLPTRDYVQTLLDAVRVSLNQDLAKVREEMGALETRVQALEKAASQITTMDGQRIPADPLQSSPMVTEVWRRLDDLENRSRRNNIRVRGARESITDLDAYLAHIFNTILADRVAYPSSFDRAHRALRPRPTDQAPPRDIICRVADYRLKQAIMTAARRRRIWELEGDRLEIFPDLAQSTLQARRALRPLTALLTSRAVAYRWSFPFALVASNNGVSATVRSVADVPNFLTSLGLPDTQIADWITLCEEPRMESRTTIDRPRRQRWRSGNRRRAPSPASQTAGTPVGEAETEPGHTI